CPDNEILITVGVSEALDLTLRSIINPGDKILIPSPNYVSYGPVTELAGGLPIYIDTRKEGFKLTPKLLEGSIDKKAKAVILNYPVNPSGISYTKKELTALKQVLQKNRLLCISDEIYGDLSYDFEHTPFATLPGIKGSTVYLNGFSKGYAMTGWRVGYACGPKDIISAMTKIHQYTIMCVSITSQMAASEAIQTGRKEVERMKREYNRRRELMFYALNKLGLECKKPQGAFYIFASVRKTGLNCLDFAKRLLKEQKVAVVPGIAFGRDFNDHVRISYTSSYENLKEALVRIEKFLSKATA
ncbi:MAG: aminotransferase class I/II-fold pyridoxal phosphate-dependent enzyme, partial [Candidatus Omnitrophica bacterium]|nr:aminotransferase class I/II-fold pyridoxal phosphate-dependent enzyme [Candidatus Omnitrophota bacterium]